MIKLINFNEFDRLISGEKISKVSIYSLYDLGKLYNEIKNPYHILGSKRVFLLNFLKQNIIKEKFLVNTDNAGRIIYLVGLNKYPDHILKYIKKYYPEELI